MIVKVKKLHSHAVIPKYAKEGDAGLDLTCVSVSRDNFGNLAYDTGLSFEIPKGFVGLLFPRSSISKKQLALTNCVGVIDSGYRGSVMMKFKVQGDGMIYTVGERIGQLIIMPYPEVKLVESDALSETERGAGGYGSTGQ